MFLPVRGVGAARLLLNTLIVSPLALPLLLQSCYMLAVLCGHAPIARRMLSEAGLHHIIASALPRVRPPARQLPAPALVCANMLRKHAAWNRWEPAAVRPADSGITARQPAGH